MEKVKKENQNRAIEILENSFRNIPGALRIIKKDRHFERRLHDLCSFCIHLAMLKKGAYISSDQKGVALMFNNKNRPSFLSMISAYFRLASKVIGLDRTFPILWKEIIISAKRPKLEHLHFWMLAVEDNTFGMRTIIEIRDFCYGLSDDLKLPIFAETRVEKNRKVYERYGFECYDSWKAKSEENELWFMLRQPKSKQSG